MEADVRAQSGLYVVPRLAADARRAGSFRAFACRPTRRRDRSQNESRDITHCTPLADRWGGWYVTGQHGAQTHRGNLVGRERLRPARRGAEFSRQRDRTQPVLRRTKYLHDRQRHRRADGARTSGAHAQLHHAAELRDADHDGDATGTSAISGIRRTPFCATCSSPRKRR